MRAFAEDKPATSEYVAKSTGLSIVHARRVLRELEERGLVKAVKPASMVVLGMASKVEGVSRKALVYAITKPPGRLIEEIPEVLDWARRMGISREDLEKLIGLR